MNLHRVEKEPDWAAVKPADWNIWQKVAAATKGMVTPGNFFSVVGLLSVPLALALVIAHDEYAAGTIVLAVGRLCDVIDGWVADKTGTKSPLGELIDASFDKVSTAVVLLGFLLGGELPWIIFGLLLLPHVLITPLAIATYFKGQRLHPSRLGKLSMGLLWVILVVILMSNSITTGGDYNPDGLVSGLLIAGFLLIAVSFCMGMAAVVGYTREFIGLQANSK